MASGTNRTGIGKIVVHLEPTLWRASVTSRQDETPDDSLELEFDTEDPRDRDRQVADLVARLCERCRAGEVASDALVATLGESSAPIRWDVLTIVEASAEHGGRWQETSRLLHSLARRWRSPMLATLADMFSDGGHALDVDYMSAVAAAVASEHAEPVVTLTEKRRQFARHGEPWRDEEKRSLIAGWREGLTIEALCDKHQRNDNSIRSQLLKLGAFERAADAIATGKEPAD
jgi:hypothetical protein